MQWTAFQRVHKANRAKVTLALEFDDIVLAVLSNDLLVQVSSDPIYHEGLAILSYLSFGGGLLDRLRSVTVSLKTSTSSLRLCATGSKSRSSH